MIFCVKVVKLDFIFILIERTLNVLSNRIMIWCLYILKKDDSTTFLDYPPLVGSIGFPSLSNALQSPRNYSILGLFLTFVVFIKQEFGPYRMGDMVYYLGYANMESFSFRFKLLDTKTTFAHGIGSSLPIDEA